MNNDLVILIDCWPGYQGQVDLRSKMCRNIINAIVKISPQLVVIATYPDWRFSPHAKTHKLISKHQFFCPMIRATSLKPLQKQIKKMRLGKIERIWFFGLHWNMCVAGRELGYKNVLPWAENLWPEVEIMFRNDCTLEVPYREEIYDSDQESWPNFFYSHNITRCEPVAPHTWRLIKT